MLGTTYEEKEYLDNHWRCIVDYFENYLRVFSDFQTPLMFLLSIEI